MRIPAIVLGVVLWSSVSWGQSLESQARLRDCIARATDGREPLHVARELTECASRIESGDVAGSRVARLVAQAWARTQDSAAVVTWGTRCVQRATAGEIALRRSCVRLVREHWDRVAWIRAIDGVPACVWRLRDVSAAGDTMEVRAQYVPVNAGEYRAEGTCPGDRVAQASERWVLRAQTRYTIATTVVLSQ
ncbi:MAG: hypothetical protein Q8Q09_19035 [Deltaproteobacteria bacterium]|nr:hypothetical protein [Deltaproteobacteria bacterium]